MGRELAYMLTSFLGAGGVLLHRNSPLPLIYSETHRHIQRQSCTCIPRMCSLPNPQSLPESCHVRKPPGPKLEVLI